MTQEATETSVVEAPVSPPAAEPAGETPAAEAPEGQIAGEAPPLEETEEKPTPATYQEWMEHIASKDDWKAEDEARIEGVRRETQSAVQKRLQPILEDTKASVEEYNRQTQQSLQYAYGIYKVLDDARKEGSIDENSLMQAYRFMQPLTNVLDGMSTLAGYYEGQKELADALGKAVGNEKLIEEFGPRFDALLGRPNATRQAHKDALIAELTEKALGSLRKAEQDKGYRRGVAEGKKAGVEVAKSEYRAGEGPPKAQGKTGGRPTAQQYAEATREQRTEWREKGVEPLLP